MRKSIVRILIAALVVSSTGCSKKADSDTMGDAAITGQVKDFLDDGNSSMSQKQGEIVVSVNGLDVTYDEFRIYLQSNKEEIEESFGGDIWAMVVDDEGTTYAQQLKQEVLNEVIYTKLICSQAESLGIVLTEDELLDVDEYTSHFLSGFSEEAMEYYSVNNDVIRNIYKDNVLSNKVYESLTLNVDTNVTDEQARQGVYQYVLKGKKGYDAEGNSYEYTEDQLQEAKELAISLHEEALETNNFRDFALANSDDQDEIEIIVGKGDMKPELESVVFALKAGEVSEIIDTEDGYFIFYCVEELNREATDEKKEEIIRERQDKAFEEKYQAWNESKEVNLNQEIFDSIDLEGEIVQ